MKFTQNEKSAFYPSKRRINSWNKRKIKKFDLDYIIAEIPISINIKNSDNILKEKTLKGIKEGFLEFAKQDCILNVLLKKTNENFDVNSFLFDLICFVADNQERNKYKLEFLSMRNNNFNILLRFPIHHLKITNEYIQETLNLFIESLKSIIFKFYGEDIQLILEEEIKIGSEWDKEFYEGEENSIEILTKLNNDEKHFNKLKKEINGNLRRLKNYF